MFHTFLLPSRRIGICSDSNYLLLRKCSKWWKITAFYFLSVCKQGPICLFPSHGWWVLPWPLILLHRVTMNQFIAEIYASGTREFHHELSAFVSSPSIWPTKMQLAVAFSVSSCCCFNDNFLSSPWRPTRLSCSGWSQFYNFLTWKWKPLCPPVSPFNYYYQRNTVLKLQPLLFLLPLSSPLSRPLRTLLLQSCQCFCLILALCLNAAHDCSQDSGCAEWNFWCWGTWKL